MKNKSIIIIIVLLIMTSILTIYFVNKNKKEVKIEKNIDEIWTCSMHPQIKMKEEGKCPICGMDLILLTNDTKNSKDIQLNQINNGLIETTKVTKKKVSKTIRLNGKAVYNEQKIFSQPVHYDGRIEKLYIQTDGEFVKKGQLIAEIYSPEINSIKQEFLEAIKNKNEKKNIYEATIQKLLNLKVDVEQIKEIEKNEKITEFVNLTSNHSGYIFQKKVQKGDYINKGQELWKVMDLSEVWVMFEVYEKDLNYVKLGDEIEFNLYSNQSKKYKGFVSFIDPFINNSTRVAQIRVEIKNTNNEIKPEMFANGILKTNQNNNTEKLFIPESSILWAGKNAYVYIKSQENMQYLIKEIILGESVDNGYVVNDGLSEGNEIVSKGVYIIDASTQLAGNESLMNLNNEIILLEGEIKKEILRILNYYIEMKDKLVESDFEKFKIKGRNFELELENSKLYNENGKINEVWNKFAPNLKNKTKSMLDAKVIDEARTKFGILSSEFILFMNNFKNFSEDIYIQYCPMEAGDGLWLSKNKEIFNPFFGERMLHCGNNKNILKK